MSLTYINLSREQLLKELERVLSKERFEHVLRVEKAALSLAKRYGCDLLKTSLAALLHDYAKEFSDATFYQLMTDYQLPQELLAWNNAIWHGQVGIYAIKTKFGLKDSTIIEAITYHTTGQKKMSLLAKILYVADYIEEGRAFVGLDRVRALAKQHLDQALALQTAQTLAYLLKNQYPIHPKTLETYNAFLPHLKAIKSTNLKETL